MIGISGGAGRPASMYSVPPRLRIRLKLWLPPKVWFHGSQSTSTGGVSSVNGQICASDCWLAHSIPCVLSTPLGIAVEPRGEEDLGHAVRADRRQRLVDRRRSAGVATSSRERRRARALGEHDLGAAEVDGGQHAAERPGVGRVDEPRLDQRGDVLDLAEVLAHQRVGGRDRHDGHAGQEAAERQQRVVDRVAGQDQQRPLGPSPRSSSAWATAWPCDPPRPRSARPSRRRPSRSARNTRSGVSSRPAAQQQPEAGLVRLELHLRPQDPAAVGRVAG